MMEITIPMINSEGKLDHVPVSTHFVEICTRLQAVKQAMLNKEMIDYDPTCDDMSDKARSLTKEIQQERGRIYELYNNYELEDIFSREMSAIYDNSSRMVAMALEADSETK